MRTSRAALNSDGRLSRGDTDKGGSNKGTLEFTWTPDIDEGDYEFYVTIDPDNLISETHESWSHETPDGNNMSPEKLSGSRFSGELPTLIEAGAS